MDPYQKQDRAFDFIVAIGLLVSAGLMTLCFAQAFHDLNDGRVSKVVHQIISIQEAQAQVLAPKRGGN